jgi:hypothetical protein
MQVIAGQAQISMLADTSKAPKIFSAIDPITSDSNDIWGQNFKFTSAFAAKT